MWALRALAVAALLALDVGAAAAQSTRRFNDSWFWGLKGGAMSYQVHSVESGLAIAPLVGADWLITRKVGGLYVAYDRSIFDRFAFVNDSVHPEDSCPTEDRPQCRIVNLRDAHRLTMAGMLFPLQTVRVQPYFGLGASITHIASVSAEGTFRNRQQQSLVEETMQVFRTVATPVVMLGTQLRLPFISAFVQGTATNAADNFFLFNEAGWRTTLEAGVRYNVGSSIDKMR